jgi:hypothetical protein
MSKSTLKKHLQTLNKDQIIEVVLEIYSNMKPVREYFEYYLSPNEKEMLEKFRQIITKEFSTEWEHSEPKLRFSVAKKAISDFRILKPSPELLADLMLTLAEHSCKITYEFGDMTEQYYNSAATNFEIALIFIESNGLLENFKPRCLDCVKWASNSGYGFADEIYDLYYSFYEDIPE